MNKSNVTIIIEDETGNIFGCYVNSNMKTQRDINDPKAFLFNIESKGRLQSAMKYDIIKGNACCAFELCPDDHQNLFSCGVEIFVRKENDKQDSYCFKDIIHFYDTKGIKKPFVEKTKNSEGKSTFIPKRIRVIQMMKQKLMIKN